MSEQHFTLDVGDPFKNVRETVREAIRDGRATIAGQAIDRFNSAGMLRFGETLRARLNEARAEHEAEEAKGGRS